MVMSPVGLGPKYDSKDKQEVYVLSNMHILPVGGRFEENKIAVKPLVTEDNPNGAHGTC
jgi:hypothetical protein